jgi:nucleoredoxin
MKSTVESVDLEKRIIKSLKDIPSAPVVGYYFSAHWCPPCRAFTPVLSKFYNTVNSKEKKIEIVFFSSDSDEDSYKSYFGTMPWLAMEFKSQVKTDLSKANGITGIPSFLIVKDGKVVLRDGRSGVASAKSESEQLELVDDWIKNL